MKKYILLLAILAFFVSSCEKEELDTYSTETNVFFTHPSDVDSILINLKGLDENMNYVNVSDSIIRIPITIMGDLSGTARAVTAKALKAKDIDVDQIKLDSMLRLYQQADFDLDYEILPSEIPANQTSGFLNIKLLNSDRLIETGDTIVAAIILTPGDGLETNYSARNAEKGKKISTVYRLYFYSNKDEAPRLWYATDNPQTNTQRTGIPAYLGSYTAEKFGLLLNACNLKAEVFEFTDEEYMKVNNITDPTTLKVGTAGSKEVFIERFGPFEVFNGWYIKTRLYVTMHPEIWDELFPDGEIVWTSGSSGTNWGTWKKSEHVR